VLEKLQELNEMEQLRQALEGFKSENAKLRRELQAKQSKSSDDMTAHASASDRKAERLEAELSSLKKKVAVCEQEHGGAGDVNAMKEELETLRQQNVEQSDSLRKLKDVLKEKVQALRQAASLKDELAALRLISEETQQRQLNEIQSTSTAMEQQQQQQHTGKVIELCLVCVKEL